MENIKSGIEEFFSPYLLYMRSIIKDKNFYESCMLPHKLQFQTLELESWHNVVSTVILI